MFTVQYKRFLKPLGKVVLALSVIFPVAGAQGGEEQSDAVGFEDVRLEVPHQARPLEVALWYPVREKGYPMVIGDNPVFRGTKVWKGSLIEEGSFPLVLLSPGSGGSPVTLGWIASRLVRQGYVVAGFRHPGTTTGDSYPQRAAEHWTRAEDISAVLDFLLGKSGFAGSIEAQDISVLGFSLGGLTALQVGGARPSLSLFREQCEGSARKREDCQYLASGGVDLSLLDGEAFGQDLRDSRIKRIVAVDPALTPAMPVKNRESIAVPTLLINLGFEGERMWATDLSDQGSGFAGDLPNSEYWTLGGANHFAFLGECKDGAGIILQEEGEEAICEDPAGSLRSVLHEKIGARILGFLKK
ncbi:alpha/beta hydrolase family protein [Kiloniella sp. b19]|uniref:alpha/beta hydrolase family protein n=1 Tax=Kiloniella sp. GXU_MW_B19 TaxID=3141326 RepID=UPI0031D8ED89